MNSTRIAKQTLFTLVAVVTLLAFTGRPLHASEPCDPPNVMPRNVCDMDSFHDAGPGQVPDGWTEFILSGNPSFSPHNDTFFGPPSLMMRIFNDGFKAGIYTQVSVQPGAGYRASAAWGAPNTPDTFGRQLGLDPTGGTDPNSPNIIWGPMHWGEGRMLNYPPPDVNIDVKARAVSDTMTLFFLVDHIPNGGDNLIFIDAVALYPDESAPAAVIPPTDTPVPTATETPAPVVVAAALPTETPIPTATALPTETPTATPTDTPTVTPTPTATPSPTPTATWTPWPTATDSGPLAALSDSPDALVQEMTAAQPEMLIMLGGSGFLGAIFFGGALLFMRRRS